MYMKKQSQRKKNSVIVAGVVRALQIRSLVDTRSQASHKSKLAEQEHNAFSLYSSLSRVFCFTKNEFLFCHYFLPICQLSFGPREVFRLLEVCVIRSSSGENGLKVGIVVELGCRCMLPQFMAPFLINCRFGTLANSFPNSYCIGHNGSN